MARSLMAKVLNQLLSDTINNIMYMCSFLFLDCMLMNLYTIHVHANMYIKYKHSGNIHTFDLLRTPCMAVDH